MAILGKQLTELDPADNLDDGDLLLIRKSGQGRDKSLTKAKLIESIGNSAISGYIAKSKEADKITLKAANQALVPGYYEGMKISFISPISTKGIVTVKIGKLPYIELQKYSSEETVTLIKDEYIEAVYTGGIFKQTNNLNTHLVWSNEYVAEAEINPDETMTVYNLTSAIGVKKTHYYKGMSLLFTVPENSKGIVFVNVDGLGSRKLGESGGSIIAKDVYENHAIMAVYDGKEFRKQKFATIHTKPLIVDIPPPEPSSISKPDIMAASSSSPPEDIPPPPKVEEAPIDIWAEDYAGNPDDPANTVSPDAIGSDGKRIFDLAFSVGSRGMFRDLSTAISSLINDFGEDGGGHKFALVIDPKNYSPYPTNTTTYEGIWSNTENADLRWITIFSKDNETVNLRASYNIMYWINIYKAAYSPIFNLPVSGSHLSLFYTNNCKAHITFGRNTNFNLDYGYNGQANGSNYIGIHSSSIEAKYGFKLYCYAQTHHSVMAIACTKLLLNKGEITYCFNNLYSSWLAGHDREKTIIYINSVANESQICNTKFLDQKSSNSTQSTKSIVANGHKLYLKNVTCKERKDKNHIGLQASGAAEVTLENCDFTSSSNKVDVDIAVSRQGRINLKKTLAGKTNQEIGKKTRDGIISIIDDN